MLSSLVRGGWLALTSGISVRPFFIHFDDGNFQLAAGGKFETVFRFEPSGLAAARMKLTLKPAPISNTVTASGF